MRVNVDSAIFGDGRLKKLAKVLGVPWTHALGLLVTAWHHTYQTRAAVVLGEDIDLAADHDGLAAGMVQAGLAAIVGKGKVRIAGVTERIGWLEEQSERSALGVAARKAARERRVNQSANQVVDQAVDRVVDPNGQPNSPSPSPSPSPSLNTRRSTLVETAVSTPARSDVRDLGQRVLAYLKERAGRGLPLRLTDSRRKRIAKLVGDGWTFDDFTVVIWHRTQSKERWLGDPKMDKYVRFETLFSPEHAEPYREEAKLEYVQHNPERSKALGWLPLDAECGEGLNGVSHV